MTVQIRWNISAFEEIRRSPGVNAILQGHVSRILAGAGPDYAGGVEAGATRSRGYVVTVNADAMIEQATDHTLLRLLGGGS